MDKARATQHTLLRSQHSFANLTHDCSSRISPSSPVRYGSRQHTFDKTYYIAGPSRPMKAIVMLA